jgi:hypothetical protein
VKKMTGCVVCIMAYCGSSLALSDQIFVHNETILVLLSLFPCGISAYKVMV